MREIAALFVKGGVYHGAKGRTHAGRVLFRNAAG